MNRVIALLRGINVGGKHKLPMAALREDLEALGLADVATYIQSGNVVFRTDEAVGPALAERIETAIETRHGFRPRVWLLTADELAQVIAANPYPQGDDAPKSVHVFFLAEEPTEPDLDALEALRVPSERFALVARAFYLLAPDGIGRSKLVEKLGKHLRVDMTARNWRTVRKLEEMAGPGSGA